MDVEPDVICHTVLIDKHFKMNNIQDATSLFKEFIDRGLKPDTVTYTALLSGYCKTNNTQKTEVSVTSILAAVGGQINQLCVSSSVPRHEGGMIHHQLDHLFSGKSCCALHTFYNQFQLLQ
ncbi:hypothetical protein NC651_025769 [Populus alba x Populus x berolinensis]|nr:hypothetical protein NC651_025769 [Populus alba x Populus x berolinensis]